MTWSDWIHLFFLSLHLSALTGTLLFWLWKGLRTLMQEVCDIPLLCGLLRCVVLFYYIPFLILALRALKHHYGYWLSIASLEKAAFVLRVPETVWLVGTVRQGLREVRAYRDSLWYMRAGSTDCPLSLRAECENLRRQLGIRRTVRCRVRYMRDAAFVHGLLRPVIYLPTEGLDRREREVVLLHEMNHIRNRDALWMLLTAVLSCTLWFLPVIAEVRTEVDVWNESSCDLATCRDTGGSRNYFDVLIRLVQRSAGGVRHVGTMELRRDEKELYRRISLIRKHQKLKRHRKSVVAFASVLFLLAGGLVVCVSGITALEVYQNVFLLTAEAVCEKRMSGEMEEHTANLDEFGGKMILFNEADPVPAAKMADVAWRMPQGVLGSSSKFRQLPGSTLSVVLRVEPVDAVIWVGVIDPRGNLCYISGVNTLSHTFFLSSAGDYRFFLYNHSSKEISVAGVYIR
ncbi:MAG: M56 family metallopeptidase [Lachnospiraceae bacterium]|nr:M56 family metallopeptidase [Lachnospiraceae bacterium]